MNEDLVKQLRRDEGVIPYAYTDSLGYLTIGVGHLIDKRKGGKLPDEIIDALLAYDIKAKTDGVFTALPWITQLSPARQGVLLNMAFQMGVDGLLGFKNTLAMIKAGDYAGAAKGMINSKWATQTPNRAKRLSVQMATDEWQ